MPKWVGCKFLFCPRRQKILKLSQLQSDSDLLLFNSLYSHSQLLIHSSSKSPYRILTTRSWEEGTSSKNLSPLPTPQLFLISPSLFLNFLGKGEFHVCYPGCLEWTHLAQSQITVCAKLQATFCSHALNTEIQTEPSKRRTYALCGGKRKRLHWSTMELGKL